MAEREREMVPTPVRVGSYAAGWVFDQEPIAVSTDIALQEYRQDSSPARISVDLSPHLKLEARQTIVVLINVH